MRSANDQMQKTQEKALQLNAIYAKQVGSALCPHARLYRIAGSALWQHIMPEIMLLQLQERLKSRSA